MRIALVQSLDSENGKIPHSEIAELLDNQAQERDFWILPEVFDSGWLVSSDNQFLGPENIAFLREMSQKHKISICGSFYIKIDGEFHNRLYVVTRTGLECYCDKRHLFGDFEKTCVKPGDSILTFEIDGVRFRAIVCYDLRFPVWCRNSDNYDALICVSQWPNSRSFDRNLLLSARAMENVAFAINANGLGASSVYKPDGRCDLQLPAKCKVGLYDLDKEIVTEIRQKKKYLADSDNFDIHFFN